MTEKNLECLLRELSGNFRIEVFGRSVLGENLYAVSKFSGKHLPWALVVGGMHAREHLSCDFVCHLMKMCACKNLNFNICFVPLSNPDGARLCEEGLCGLDEKTRERLIEINGSEDFSLYKANARGVDLNNNWDAGWERKFTNKFSPSSQGFYGEKPMSEPEVKALAALTEKLSPQLVLTYHLKGEEIYFDFFQEGKRYERDKKIAEIFASTSGYVIKRTQDKSSGGYKDWCVQKLGIPTLTIELGSDKFSHPFPKSELKQICRKNAAFFENVQKSLQIYQDYQKDIKI